MKLQDNHIGDTVRVRRPPPKVFTDASGQSVWMAGVAAVECKLEIEPEVPGTDPYNSAGCRRRLFAS